MGTIFKPKYKLQQINYKFLLNLNIFKLSTPINVKQNKYFKNKENFSLNLWSLLNQYTSGCIDAFGQPHTWCTRQTGTD